MEGTDQKILKKAVMVAEVCNLRYSGAHSQLHAMPQTFKLASDKHIDFEN